MKSNAKDKDDVCYVQPKNLNDRIAIANDFTKRFKYPVPFGIDEMTNAANDAYAAWPERLYIIDESGQISYKGGNGPFNYDPKANDRVGRITLKLDEKEYSLNLTPEQRKAGATFDLSCLRSRPY